MLKLRNIFKEYTTTGETKVILNNVSYDFPPSGFVTILGESGSGKSTLLNLLSLNEKPTSGEILYDGEDISHFKECEIEAFRREEIGFLYQKFNLFSELTAFENIIIPLKIKGMKKKEMENLASSFIHKFNLVEVQDTLAKDLSGGELERVAFIRSIIASPFILLADEPTGSLDDENGEILLKELKEYSRRRLVIMVTHDRENAEKYSDIVLRLEKGRLIEEYKRDGPFLFYPNEKEKSHPNQKWVSLFTKDLIRKNKKEYLFLFLASSLVFLTLFLSLGFFNGKDILETPPLNNVTIQGSNYTLAKLETDNTQNLKSTLIKELLKSEATIYSNVEKNVQFGKRTLPNTKLLLLDISGSMSGSALEELKNAVIELSVHTPIKWIAFNDNVVCTSEEEVDLMSLQANGGTCYIPPLEKAREIMEDCYVDQVILISDGQPFESISEILEKAYGLNQPVNVISIGQSGVETMKELAEKTGGTQIVVENAAQLDTQLGNDLNVLLTAGEQGTFAFGDLLRKCHIPGCARALYDFSINRMVSARQSIAYLLVKYGNKEGLAEWGKVAGASCRYQQAGNRSVSRPWCKLVVEDGLEDNLLKKLYEIIPGIEVEKLSDMPDLFAFLLCMESIELKDLQWAGIPADTTLIDQKSQLAGYGVGSTEKAINIYGKEFTLKA